MTQRGYILAKRISIFVEKAVREGSVMSANQEFTELVAELVSMFPDPPLNRTPPADPRFDEQGNPVLITPEQAVKLMADSLPDSGQYTPHNPVAVKTDLPPSPGTVIGADYVGVKAECAPPESEAGRMLEWYDQNWRQIERVLFASSTPWVWRNYQFSHIRDAIRAAMDAEQKGGAK